MNSKSKQEQMQEDQASYDLKIREASAIMAAKIQHQIKSYQLRKLSAQCEYADLFRVTPVDLDDYSYMPDIRARRVLLQQEISFCTEQIRAYQENDNKAKIIPDRLL